MDAVDLVVIGTGGAAMAAGIEARSRGKSAVLVEHGPLGGTCLNIGCVPSKNLLAAAGWRHRAQANPFPAVPTGAGDVDMAALTDQKQELIDRLRQLKYADVAEAHGFPVRYGHARFVDEQTLEVDGQPLVAPAYVVATGAAPHIPDLPGLAGVDYLTSTTAMELTRLPESLIVLGGGYVGLEQAQLFAHLGVQVTVVGRFAPHTEPEIAAVLREVFADDGITVVEERGVAVAGSADGVVVTTSGGGEAKGQRLLVATGRYADTGDLGLEAAGVKTDERGFVVVDTHQRTTNPRIFAAGDVSRAPQYVYVAAQTGHAAAAGALGAPTTVDYRGLPGVTFTTPQLGGAGLTEEQALARGHACDCRVLGAQDIPRALANRDTRGALKLVIDADTGQVLGVHAALDGAGDVMLAATYAIKFGLTVDDLADTWAPYLTMSEALRIAAGLFRTDKPTSCCA
ncbi:mercury(II) reductase [Blastococcus goldschmidtiae]|uniref:Mercuric reductase n=1 Tax=Blastococcus goldschmidtiae TaxID=3075546 RepID=A0ABU2K5S7_9ACTN|nr:mercury(II) reductase [Blastococcus sp. DSM 46792]MDT0275546.1 mercury(II) reductase [Blastococcus sp. DSM 46792]